MLVDLHAHFPMQLLPDEQQRTHERAQNWWRRRWRAQLVRLISHFANYQGPGDEPSVTTDLMRAGDVGVALSVLYQPFDEMDLSQSYGASPRATYIGDLIAQIDTVEDYAGTHAAEVAIAHNPAELDALLGGGRPILIHAVEGGFHLGDTEAEVTRNVSELASRGVAYITIAHLFFRQLATNAPALPFLPDWLYHRVFPQPPHEGLTELGRAAVAAMVAAGMLIDITHMSAQSAADVFAWLDAHDPDRRVPVIATHMACRFGKLEYCLDDATIQSVAARGGVLGTILCEHYITDGLGMTVTTFEHSVSALCRHIDRIRELTGSHDHAAIGSDLDGYIKPALPGLEHHGRMAEFQAALADRYGAGDAENICSANALRVLRQGWGAAGPSGTGATPSAVR
jgi:microsomal dipeptidase-like Zn-dependent dipeptidase